MKKILTTSTKLVQAGFAVKGLVDCALHPVKFARNILKGLIIKTLVFVIKQGVNLSIKGKVNTESHIVIRQLNALTDVNVDMTGLKKNINFKMTLDSLLKEAVEVEEYKVLKYVNLTKIKNKITSFKNDLRNDIYAYIVENNFENMTSLVNGVNEVFKLPTEIVDCEFVNCKITPESHDEVKKEFVLIFDVCFALKSSIKYLNSH